jgi:hypothetical protein
MIYPETDDPATFGKSNALPMAFAFAVAAYEQAQAAQAAEVPHSRRGSKARPEWLR